MLGIYVVVVDSRSILTLDDYKAYAGTAPIESGESARLLSQLPVLRLDA